MTNQCRQHAKAKGGLHPSDGETNSDLGFITLDSEASDMASLRELANQNLSEDCQVIMVNTPSGSFIIDEDSIIPYGENAGALRSILTITE